MNIDSTISSAKNLANEMPTHKIDYGPCGECSKPDSPWSLVRKNYICDECLKKEFNNEQHNQRSDSRQ